jgi:hypothetical protein
MKPERDPGYQAQALRKPTHRGPQGAKRTMRKVLWIATETSVWQPASESEPGSDLEVKVLWRPR